MKKWVQIMGEKENERDVIKLYSKNLKYKIIKFDWRKYKRRWNEMIKKNLKILYLINKIIIGIMKGVIPEIKIKIKNK